MSRICGAEGFLLKLEVFLKEKLFSGRMYDLYGLIRLRIKTLLVAVLNSYELQITRYLC